MSRVLPSCSGLYGINPPAGHPSLLDGQVSEVLNGNLLDGFIENDPVRKCTPLDDTSLSVEKRSVRCGTSKPPHGLIKGESLIRMPPFVRAVETLSRGGRLARDSGIDPLKGVRRLDGKITAEDGSNVPKRLHAICLDIGSEGAKALKGEAHVVCRMGRLNGRDEANLVHANLVGRMDNLGMLDAEAVLSLADTKGLGIVTCFGAYGLETGGECVDDFAIRKIANGMNVDLITGESPGSREVGHGGSVDEKGTCLIGMIRVGLQQGGTPAPKSAVCRVTCMSDRIRS